jgi:hypothetical protein
MISVCCFDSIRLACLALGKGRRLATGAQACAVRLIHTSDTVDDFVQNTLLETGLTKSNVHKLLQCSNNARKRVTVLADRVDSLRTMFSVEALNTLVSKDPLFVVRTEPATVADNIQVRHPAPLPPACCVDSPHLLPCTHRLCPEGWSCPSRTSSGWS